MIQHPCASLMPVPQICISAGRNRLAGTPLTRVVANQAARIREISAPRTMWESGAPSLNTVCRTNSPTLIFSVVSSVVYVGTQTYNIVRCAGVRPRFSVIIYANRYYFHGVHRRAFHPPGLGAQPQVSGPQLWPSDTAMLTICIALYSSTGSTPRAIQSTHARHGLTRMARSGQKRSSLSSCRLHESSFSRITQASSAMPQTFRSQAMHSPC